MNDWAKHYGGEFDRRVYRREFAGALGIGITWFRHLEKQGVIPAGRHDPGGKRLWWYASEVSRALDAMGKDAVGAVAQ